MSYDLNWANRATDMETGDPIPGIHVKALYDELGPNPRGGAATVTQRFQQIDGTVAAKADAIHGHPAEAIVSGTISPARLGTGTPTQYTVLNGQGQWVALSQSVPGLIALGPDDPVPAGVPVDTIIIREEG